MGVGFGVLCLRMHPFLNKGKTYMSHNGDLEASEQSKRSSLALFGLVALAGIAAGLAFVFFKDQISLNGNLSQQVQACEASSQLAETISPLVHGPIASLQISQSPADINQLAFKRADGSATSMADFNGRAVLLNLWATWCAPCRKEMPDLDELQASLGGDDFEVVTVSIDRGAPAVAQAFLDEIETKHLALYYDESMKIFQALKSQGMAFGMPTTLVVDQKGCALGHMAGPANWADPVAQTMLKAVIKSEK